MENEYYKIIEQVGVVAFVSSPEYDEYPIPEGSITHLDVLYSSMEEARREFLDNACNWLEKQEKGEYCFALVPMMWVRKK